MHALRKRPVGELSTEEMRRLIGQDIGMCWLLPMALEHLRVAARQEAVSVWLDDDLLSAVVSPKADREGPITVLTQASVHRWSSRPCAAGPLASSASS